MTVLCMFVGCSTGKDTDTTDTGITGDADTDADADADADADSDADTDTGPLVECVAPTGDPATVELAGPCPLETKLGPGFTVSVLADYSTVNGYVLNAVIPVTVLEPMAEEGSCKLLRRNNPFCDPVCGPSETCDFDDDGDGLGDCVPFPTNQDMGIISVCGLNEDVVMHPIPPPQYFDVSVPHPVTDPGELIELQSHGTTFGGADFTMHGVGIEPMVIPEADSLWVIQSGQDLPITWESSGDSIRSEIHVRVNIDQHGTTPVDLNCVMPDTGSGSLPASLLDLLISFGVTGFPNATVTRRTVDSVTFAEGCVQFEVNSPANPSVRVDGYIPCTTDLDCQGYGLTDCNDITFICE